MFEGTGSSACVDATAAASFESEEAFPIFFLMLPPIDRMDPIETRDGEVSFVLAGASVRDEIDWSKKGSGSEIREEASGRGEGESKEDRGELPPSAATLLGPAASGLKPRRVLDLFMKEPPAPGRFFLGERSEGGAFLLMMEPEAERREGVEMRGWSALDVPSSGFKGA